MNETIFRKGNSPWNKGRKFSQRTSREKLAYILAWKKRNPDKVAAIQKRTYIKNRSSLLVRARKSQLKRLYKITPEEYDRLLKGQDYQCAICKKHKDFNRKGYDLAVDHNHTTGKVRGLLCVRCNISLGGFQDSEELLLKAALYLKHHASS